MTPIGEIQISQAEAHGRIVKFLSDRPDKWKDKYFDLRIEWLLDAVAADYGQVTQEGIRDVRRQVSQVFFDATWELCCLGVLRPGEIRWEMGDDCEGRRFVDYSLTEYGKAWIQERKAGGSTIPSGISDSARALEKFQARFGDGYQQRSQDAIRCWRARAYFACCAMCGAAAESVMLAIATQKTGDPQLVLSEYNAAGGRRRIEDRITTGLKKGRQEELKGHTSLLKYWRDNAAHGAAVDIHESAANLAVFQLIGFALFADKNWDELTN